MITAEEYDQTLRSRRHFGKGDEPPELTSADEEVLDRVWREVADEDGVEQLPDQPSPDEIKAFRA